MASLYIRDVDGNFVPIPTVDVSSMPKYIATTDNPIVYDEARSGIVNSRLDANKGHYLLETITKPLYVVPSISVGDEIHITYKATGDGITWSMNGEFLHNDVTINVGDVVEMSIYRLNLPAPSGVSGEPYYSVVIKAWEPEEVTT